MAVVLYSKADQPPQVHLVEFSGMEQSKGVNDIAVEHIMLDQLKVKCDELKQIIKELHKERIRLDNGAEGFMVRVKKEYNPA